MAKARRNGVRTPAIYSVDLVSGRFVMELIHGLTLKQAIIVSTGDDAALQRLGQTAGSILARLHNLDIVHGDLTTSNCLVEEHSGELLLIDFGLSYTSIMAEDKAVDLYVLERAISSTHPECSKEVFEHIMQAYEAGAKNAKAILSKLADVQLRGRKRDMIG